MSPAYTPFGSLAHPLLGEINYRMDEVSDDPDTQVAQVIGMMCNYAVDDCTSPEIQTTASNLINSHGEPITAVFNHVKGRISFTSDESAVAPLQDSYAAPIVEALIRPRDIDVMPLGYGDCDDYSMYGASLLLALGVPCSFATVAADPREPSVYSHVYVVAYPTSGPYAGVRVPLDCSHGPYPGWEFGAGYPCKRQEWPVSKGSGLCALALAGSAALLLYTLVKR